MSGDADLPTIVDVSEPDPGPGADFGALPGLDGVSNLAGASASLAKEGVDLSALLGSAPSASSMPAPSVPSMPDFDAVPSFDPPAFDPPSFSSSSSLSGSNLSASNLSEPAPMPSFEADPISSSAAVAANDEFDDAIFDLDLDALDDETPAVAASPEPEPVHVEPVHAEPVHVEPEPVFQPQIPMPDMTEAAPLALEADPIVPEIAVPEIAVPEIAVPEVPAAPAFEFTPQPVAEVIPEPVQVEPVQVEPVQVEPAYDPEPVVPGFQPGYAAGAFGAAALAVAATQATPEPVAEVAPEPARVEPAHVEPAPAPWIATPAPTPSEMPAAVTATRDFFTLSVLRRTFNPVALKDTLGSLSGAVDGGVPATVFLARAANRAKLEGAAQISLARLEAGQLVTLETPALEASFREIVAGVAQAGHAASHADLLIMDVANSSEEIVVPVQGALLTLDGTNGEQATLTLAGKFSATAGSGFLERVAAALENPLHLMI
jgi:hypothetical protein